MLRATFSSKCVVAVTAANLVVGAQLIAQEADRVGNRLVPHISASGAVDLRGGHNDYRAMYLGTAALDWSTRTPGLGLRLEAMYASRGSEPRLYPASSFEPCGLPEVCDARTPQYTRVRALGVTLGATYDIIRHGRVRPYVVGGTGVVRMNQRIVRRREFLCPDPCVIAAGTTPVVITTITTERPMAGTAHVGAGAVLAWRWVSIVGETRYIAVTNRFPRGLNGAMPFSLGLRF